MRWRAPGPARPFPAIPTAITLAIALVTVSSAPAQEREEPSERALRECAAQGAEGVPGIVGDSVGRIVGRVVDRESEDPVRDAAVRLSDREGGILTDESGHFAFIGIPGGSHLLRVEHPFFADRSSCVTVPFGRSVELEVVLAPEPVALDSLRVTVEEVRTRWLERQGFYRRRDMAGGIFFTRRDIVDEDPARLSSLFRGKSGVELDDGRLKPRHPPTTILTTPECDPQFFVNGRRMRLPLGIDTYQPGDVEAIEAYFGESRLPAQFNVGRAACGIVVIWLRVRP